MSDFVKSRNKIFCANPNCGRREMRVVKNGIQVLETSQGGREAYKLWPSDVLECPTCKAKIARTGDGYEHRPDMTNGLSANDLICVERDWEIDVAERLFRETKRWWITAYNGLIENTAGIVEIDKFLCATTEGGKYCVVAEHATGGLTIMPIVYESMNQTLSAVIFLTKYHDANKKQGESNVTGN